MPKRSVVDQFRDSMRVDHEKWHDGIGYDLSLLQTATPSELAEIEQLVAATGVRDWRDVEALAALDTLNARRLIGQTLESGTLQMRVAVVTHAAELVPEKARIATLVEALEGSDFYEGLTQALLEVESFHPPEVVDALFRGALHRDGEVACNFAGMLLFVHGKTTSSFDWDERPFFLRFNTEDAAERAAVFAELCARLGVEPAAWHHS